MVTTLPSLVGYPPADAEAVAAAHGVRTVLVHADSPRWLHPTNEPRVARQRLREDGSLELLVVLAPSIVP